MTLDPVADAGLLALDLIAFSAAGVAVSMLYFLTFFPPESYRRRLEKTGRPLEKAEAAAK
jgi:hypothetical protein